MKTWIHYICPFPHIHEDDVHTGLSVDIPSVCRKKCRARVCLTPDNSDSKNLQGVRHFQCDRGFSFYCGTTDHTSQLILCGLIDRVHNNSADSNLRRTYRGNRISPVEVEEWYRNMEKAAAMVSNNEKSAASEALLIFHDVRSSVTAVYNNLASCLRADAGNLDPAHIDEHGNHELVTAYRSAQLLTSQLSLMDVIANPDSAAYSRPRKTRVYELFHLHKWIFQKRASHRKIRIKLEGTSYNAPRLYDSFLLIPHVLIDNAVKYSLPNQTVLIKVDDVGDSQGVRVSVKSYGPTVDAEERAAIFERRFRGMNVDSIAVRGSGMGLWIAGRVAGAHGFTISYSATGIARLNGALVGESTFAFEAHSV